MLPKISVIVPVYKTEHFLRRCLDSIAGQTYKNLEIILVDDGSPDNCGAICDEYAAKDGRFTVLHTPNRGVSAARNAALEIAAGQWIGFVDSDDWIEPDMYEYLYRKGSSSSADVVQCGFFFDEKDESSAMFCPEEDRFIAGDASHYSLEDMQIIAPSACCKLFSAKCVKNVTYDTRCIYGEDFMFNIQVLSKASGLLLCSGAKYHYNQNDASICHAPASVNVVRSQRQAFKAIGELFEKKSHIRAFIETERLKLDMHNCSRIVQHPHWEIACLKKEIRSDLRCETIRIQMMKTLSLKSKGKLFLIGWAWWIYRILLLLSKKL